MLWSRGRTFTNEHVCITGGSEGLGLCLGLQFVEEGSNITIISRSKPKLEAAAQTLNNHAAVKNSPSKITWRSADVSDTISLEKAIQTAKEELGPVDVLICCAGSAQLGRFLDVDMDVFQDQMKVNYMGTVAAVKLVAPDMVKRKTGDIVLIASALAVMGLAGHTTYAPTKWAMRGFADCLRMEMQAHGVRVCISYPPYIKTPGHDKEVLPPEMHVMKRACKIQVHSAVKAAECIVSGLRKGRYHLPTPDFLQSISQSTMSSLSPHPYWTPLQMVVSCLSIPVKSYITSMFDRIVRKTIQEEIEPE